MEAHKHLIDWAITNGYVVQVEVEDELEYEGHDYKLAVEASEAGDSLGQTSPRRPQACIHAIHTKTPEAAPSHFCQPQLLAFLVSASCALRTDFGWSRSTSRCAVSTRRSGHQTENSSGGRPV